MAPAGSPMALVATPSPRTTSLSSARGAAQPPHDRLGGSTHERLAAVAPAPRPWAGQRGPLRRRLHLHLAALAALRPAASRLRLVRPLHHEQPGDLSRCLRGAVRDALCRLPAGASATGGGAARPDR